MGPSKRPKNSLRNKNILKNFNIIIYNIVWFIYNILTIFVHPFQRKFINIYSAELQLNRLPLRVLPNLIKYILIYFVDIDSWVLFFKRIKNHSNLYIRREKNFPRLHRFWCIFFRDKSIYYSELNIKKIESHEISNFFYNVRFWKKGAKVISDRRHKNIIFYYLNKFALTNHPYLYWTYFFNYTIYQYNSNAPTISVHIRTHIFFILLENHNTFIKSNKTKSFVKFDFYTFKGIKRSILNRNKIKNFNQLFNKKQKKDKILSKIEEHAKLFDKIQIQLYYNIINPSKILVYKFYINYIIHDNLLRFNEITQNIFLKSPKIFIIRWYNKLHMTTSNINKNSIVLFLRASKHFNKGRYSRNRQLYRTGVYWCIWLNVILVYSLHFYFYRIVYSFGYFWVPLGLFILSIFSSRLYKYRYYSYKNLFVELTEFNNFIFYFFRKIYHVYYIFIKLKILNFNKFWANSIYILYIFILSRLNLVKNFFKKIIF